MRVIRLTFIGFLCCALACCSAQVKEEDRQLVEQGEQIAAIQDEEYARIEQAINDGDLPKAKAIIKEARAVNADAGANASTLKGTLGAPQQAVPYTAASAEALRAAAKKAHTDLGFWAWMVGAITAGGSIALGIARSPLARMIPGFGPVFTALDTTITGVEKWMAAQKAAGNHEVAADLASTLFAAHDEKNVADYVMAKVEKVQEKLPIV